MTTKEVASRLVDLCRQGKFEAAQKELFAKDSVSIEPQATPAFQKETKGLNAILQKGEKWKTMVEKQNKLSVSEPLIAGNSFAVAFHMDVVMKERGPVDMTELAVYHVKDGKVVSEEFSM
jgi:hypothetical protein